jgi:hypothetical protein
MTTNYENQSCKYLNTNGKSISIIPNTGLLINNGPTETTTISSNNISLNVSTNSSVLSSDKLTFDTGLNMNTLDANQWSGNIKTVNNNNNLTISIQVLDKRQEMSRIILRREALLEK